MFHIHLRQFPHSHTQFNLSDEDIRSLAELWVSGEWLVIGEHKWSPHQARLTIIEGPQLAVGQLSMGRGWRNAERDGEEVTQRVLAAAGAQASAVDAGPLTASAAAGTEASALLALLGDGSRAQALLAAWRATAARLPERPPSESLALAEKELDNGRAAPPS
jgi:hypothetical protein